MVRNARFHLVWTSYAVLAMTEQKLAEQPFIDGPNCLERQLADVLRQAQAEGELAPELDASAEAASLLVINHGLGTSVLVGQRTAKAARAVLRYHLHRLFNLPAEATVPSGASDTRRSDPGRTRARSDR